MSPTAHIQQLRTRENLNAATPQVLALSERWSAEIPIEKFNSLRPCTLDTESTPNTDDQHRCRAALCGAIMVATDPLPCGAAQSASLETHGWLAGGCLAQRTTNGVRRLSFVSGDTTGQVATEC